MNEKCADNRFQIIRLAKRDMLNSTNIETRPEELAVLDSILFRCWQMGWLEKYNATMHAVQESVRKTAVAYFRKQSDAKRARLVNHAMLGAEWLYLNGREALHDIMKESERRYPIPPVGRDYVEAENVSAFQMGAYWTFDIMVEKIEKKDFETEQ